MASLNSPCHALFLALVIVASHVSPAISTSRRGFERPKELENGFRVALEHVDSGKNLTKWEKIQRGIRRGEHRLHMLNVMLSEASDSRGVQAPVMAGNGEFLMNLSIGTPPKRYSAIMDTGSDLIWTQCKPCHECFKQYTPIFDPKKSSTYANLPCSSHLCNALPKPTCGHGCEYSYMYGDYSSTQGSMGTETFTFGKVRVPKIGFGCGQDNEGNGFAQGAGLVGLGRGPLSLVSQLKDSKFSYCLTPFNETQKSTLLLGSFASVNRTFGAIKTTPLIRNPSQPSFYYLTLQGISVGKTRLPIKKSTFELQGNGTGGFIIDSGTTITYLERSAFHQVRKAFARQMKLHVDTSGSTEFELCFKLPSGSRKVKVPKLVFHFDGTDLDLPAENYMVSDSDSDSGLICLAMASSSGLSIFGNIQQQNMMVVYDLKKKNLSFIETQCHKL